MLTADSKPITRKWAIALIIVSIVRISVPFVGYFQTKSQLVSPYISQTITLDIVDPYMIIGIISAFITLIAFIFFVYSKFLFSIITCTAGLVFLQLYFVIFYH
jgi:hypothetical protein